MNKRAVREATSGEAIVVMLLILVVFVVGFGIIHADGMLVLITAAIIGGVFAKILGHTWTEMAKEIALRVGNAFPALMVLLATGLLVGSWMAAGIIPMMIYYGLKLISPEYLIPASFCVCIIVSIVCGTSWGTVATIGVAVIGIAMGLGVPLPMVAGAIISGAYFGDKMSPLSDTTIMAALMAKTDVYDHIRQMTVTTFPAMVIAGILYLVLGRNVSGADMMQSPIYRSMVLDLSTNFNFNIILLIPMLIVVVCAAIRIPTVPALVASALMAMGMAVSFQGLPFSDAIQAGRTGFHAGTMMPGAEFAAETLKLINRGGLSSMFESVIYALVAFCFGGMLSVTRCLEIALRRIVAPMRTVATVVNAAGLSAGAIVGLSSNCNVTFFLVADIFGKKFQELRLKEQNLSRVMEDFATLLECLMPWTVSGIYMASTIGVPNLSFAPYAFFNYGCAALSIFYALTSKTFSRWAFSYYDAKHNPEVYIEGRA
ncbi:MAG: Na+/H+ antiporter NhaC [Planctomycetaceae bacterium]|nr:Na+/H+ antiporter NhaC [Planctomycetaceae bacterium]